MSEFKSKATIWVACNHKPEVDAADRKIKEEVAAGANAEEAFSKSTICGTMAPTELGALRAADGQENLAK